MRPPTSQDLLDRVEKSVKHFFTFFSTCLDLTLPKSYSTVPGQITDLHWSYTDDDSFSRFQFWGNEDYSHKKWLNWSKQGSLHRFKRNLHQDFPFLPSSRKNDRSRYAIVVFSGTPGVCWSKILRCQLFNKGIQLQPINSRIAPNFGWHIIHCTRVLLFKSVEICLKCWICFIQL